MKDELFKEVHSLVEDLINKGENLEADIKGQKISGVLDGHEVLFRWEGETLLYKSGQISAQVVYHLSIDQIGYCGNCTLIAEQEKELQALWELREGISKIAMRGKDKSPVLKFMEERRRGLV